MMTTLKEMSSEVLPPKSSLASTSRPKASHPNTCPESPFENHSGANKRSLKFATMGSNWRKRGDKKHTKTMPKIPNSPIKKNLLFLIRLKRSLFFIVYASPLIKRNTLIDKGV
jgi:hypothetical protein